MTTEQGASGSGQRADLWLVLHSFSGLMRMAVQLGVMMVLVPVIIHYAGKERYGLWTLGLALAGMLSFLEFGLNQGANRCLSALDYRVEQQKLIRVTSTSFWLLLGAGLLLLLFVLPWTEGLARLFDVPSRLVGEAGFLFFLFILRQALWVPLRAFSAVLLSQRLMVRAHASQSIAQLVYLGGGWFVLAGGYGLWGLAWVYLGIMLLEHILYLVFSRQAVPLAAYHPRHVSLQEMKRIFEFSSFAWIGQVVFAVFTRASVLIVQLTAGLVATAAFGVALRLTSISKELAQQVIYAGSPKVTRLAALDEEHKEEAGWLTLSLARRALLLTGPLAAVAFVLGDPFLESWVSREVATLGAIPLAIMALEAALGTGVQAANNSLNLTGVHRWVNLWSLLSVVVYLPLAYLGGKYAGTAGVALAVLLVTLVVLLPFVLRRLAQHIGFPFHVWWHHVYRHHLAPFAVCLLGAWGLRELLLSLVAVGKVRLLLIAGAGLFCLGLYGLVYFLWTAPERERRQLALLWGRLWQKIFPQRVPATGECVKEQQTGP